MTTVNASEVALGIESFGDDDPPLVVLAGGTTMLPWPDALCERLVAGGRRVVRYDLRDSGESTTTDPEAPAYTLRDLAADAAALADALGGGPAHLAGIRRADRGHMPDGRRDTGNSQHRRLPGNRGPTDQPMEARLMRPPA
jgi:pimeloyl-ACP methyl ester carboxylesterase